MDTTTFVSPMYTTGAIKLPYISQRVCSASRMVQPVMVAAKREKTGRVTGLLNGEDLPPSRAKVNIERPARNQRRVSASNLINAPMDIVWTVLSDYGRLAQYIPNLALSERRPHPTGGIRVEQCGAQSILGFEFRASLVMDMTEVNATSTEQRAIEFALVTSRDFNEFEGIWRMERVDCNRTALYYTVQIMPKGLVPVRAIEWRISEDVPQNMDAVRQECERRRRNAVADSRRQQFTAPNSLDI